jgi:hypothetical protein
MIVTLKDGSGTTVRTLSLPPNHALLTGSHEEGRRCAAPDVDDAIRQAATGGNWTREVTNALTDVADMVGTVVAVNYDTCEILINLGEENGIRSKADGEGTEFAMYLLDEVDPKTGHFAGRMDDQCVIGPEFREWLEVQRVGRNWCVAQPKQRERLTGRTITSVGMIHRVFEPGSGLVRVRVTSKRGKKK